MVNFFFFFSPLVTNAVMRVSKKLGERASSFYLSYKILSWVNYKKLSQLWVEPQSHTSYFENYNVIPHLTNLLQYKTSVSFFVNSSVKC